MQAIACIMFLYKRGCATLSWVGCLNDRWLYYCQHIECQYSFCTTYIDMTYMSQFYSCCVSIWYFSYC